MHRLVSTLFVIASVTLPATAQELTGTLKKIKDSGTITLGVRDSSPPFSYLDDKQKTVGYAIDICSKIVEEVKAELKMEKIDVKENVVNSSNRIPLMANGTIDVECGTTTNNLDRQKQVAFTNTHFLTTSRFASKKAAGLAGISDLKGKSVVSVSGSANLIQLNRANQARSLGATVLTAKDVAEGFLMLETDRVQAFVMDDVQLATLITASKDPSAYVVSTDEFSEPEPLAIMMRRGDEPFKAVVDRATRKLYQSPEMQALYSRWFMAPVPPRGLNFNVPMSPALKRSFENPSDSADPSRYGG